MQSTSSIGSSFRAPLDQNYGHQVGLVYPRPAPPLPDKPRQEINGCAHNVSGASSFQDQSIGGHQAGVGNSSNREQPMPTRMDTSNVQIAPSVCKGRKSAFNLIRAPDL